MHFQRALRIRRRFHVDAHERVQLARALEDLAQVGHAQLARQVQPELRQLQRDVALDLLAGQRFDRFEVRAHRALRFGGVGDAFAQVVQADQQALRVQRLGDDDAVR